MESSKPYIRPLGKGKTIVMMEKHSLTGAPAHMKALGQRTDDSVLDYVRGHTGATVSQIARSLRITNGRVDGSTNRLAEKGLLDVKHFLRNGKLVKRAYPRGLATRRPDIMEISPILVDTESWGDAVALYALSRSAIGISPRAYLEWEEASLYKCHAAVERQKDNVLLKIPERFVGFYELPNSEIDISGIEDKALVTIQSTIIPVDVPIGTQEEAEYGYRHRHTRLVILDVDEDEVLLPTDTEIMDTGQPTSIAWQGRLSGSSGTREIEIPSTPTG